MIVSVKEKEKTKVYYVKWYREAKLTTKCIIQNDKKEVLIKASATCNYKDIFTKERGRKASLTKALQLMDRQDRKPFWDAYRITTKIPKW